MPSVGSFAPRAVNVELFEYRYTILVGYILFVLFVLSLYRGYRTRQRMWFVSAALLGLGGLSLFLLNLYLLGVPVIG